MTELKDIEKEIGQLSSTILSLYQIRSLYLFQSSKWYETEAQILNETNNWRLLKEKLNQLKLKSDVLGSRCLLLESL